MIDLDKKTVSDYGSNYSPSKLVEKLGKVAKKAGVKVVYAVLLLYYALLDGDVPLKDKTIVVGALGYFILPIDLIPDMLGAIGFSDDLGVLVMALQSIWSSITPSVHERARAKLGEWFDDIDPEELVLF